jgi:hypothetical protein
MTIFMALALIAFLCANLERTPRTCRARDQGGWVIKQGKPNRYWRHGYSNYGLLMALGIMLFWWQRG